MFIPLIAALVEKSNIDISKTLLPLSLELYHNGSVKLDILIQALTSNPAKILKILNQIYF